MAVVEAGSGVMDWAEEALLGSGLPAGRNVERIWLVEIDHGCICITTRGVWSKRARARTALLKESVNGPVVYRFVDGWGLPNPTSKGAT